MFEADGSLSIDTFPTRTNNLDWQPSPGQSGLSAGLHGHDSSFMMAPDIGSFGNTFSSQRPQELAQAHPAGSFQPSSSWWQGPSSSWQQNEVPTQPLTPYKTASTVQFSTQPRGHRHRQLLHSDFLSLGGCPSPPLSPTARPPRSAQCRSGAQYDLHPSQLALQSHDPQMTSSSSLLAEFDAAAMRPQFFRRQRSSPIRNRPGAGATKSAFSTHHSIPNVRGVSVSPVKSSRHGTSNGNSRTGSSSFSPRKRVGAKAFATVTSGATSSSSSRGTMPPPPPPFPQTTSTHVGKLDSSSFPPLSACEGVGSGTFGTPVSTLTRDFQQTLLQPAPGFPLELSSCASYSSSARRTGAPQALQLMDANVDIQLPQLSATTLEKFDFGFLDADPFGGTASAGNNASQDVTPTTLPQLGMGGAGLSAELEPGTDLFEDIFLSKPAPSTTEEATLTKHRQSESTHTEQESHDFDATNSLEDDIFGNFNILGSGEETLYDQITVLTKFEATSNMTEESKSLSGIEEYDLHGIDNCTLEARPSNIENDKTDVGCDFVVPPASSGEWSNALEAADMTSHSLPFDSYQPDTLSYEDQNVDEPWLNSIGDPDSLFLPSAFSPTPPLPPPLPRPPVPVSPLHYLRTTTAPPKDYRSSSVPRAATCDHTHGPGYHRRRRTTPSTSPTKAKSRAYSSTSASSTTSAEGAFVNYTSLDAPKIMRSVAPSGSSKTKAKREAAAAAEKRAWQEAVVRAMQVAGGDVGGLVVGTTNGDNDGCAGREKETRDGEGMKEEGQSSEEFEGGAYIATNFVQ